MTAQEVFLKAQDFRWLDALAGELAEAGVDAVDGGAAGQELFETASRLLDPLPGLRCETEPDGAAMQDVFGVRQRQPIALEFEGVTVGGMRSHMGMPNV